MIPLIDIPKKVVLASASPRRKELLAQMGITFDIVPSLAEEEFLKEGMPEPAPSDYVCRLAALKAEDTASRLESDCLVIGADTVVVREGRILGKPQNREEAIAMLLSLQGGWHDVLTGVAVIDRNIRYRDISCACTRVEMAHLSLQQIERYVDSGECIDKAGAYGIQGLAAAFIPRIEGCYFNVVGLPVSMLYTMLLKYKAFINLSGEVIEYSKNGNTH